MPTRPGRKRKRNQEDPLASDSDDEDFSDRQAQTPRKKTGGKGTAGKRTSGKGKRKTIMNKGRRAKKDSYDSDDDEELSASGDGISIPSDREQVTFGASGRPVRSSRKAQPVNYEEDESNEDMEESSSSDSEDGDEEDAGNDVKEEEEVGGGTAATATTTTTGKRSMVVRIKLPARSNKQEIDQSAEDDQQTEDHVPSTRRNTRATSASAQSRPTTGGKGPAKTAMKSAMRTRGSSAGPPGASAPLNTRRSSRLGNTDEPLARLTNSGKHVEIVGRPGNEEAILEEGESLHENSSREGVMSGGDSGKGVQQEAGDGEVMLGEDEGAKGADDTTAGDVSRSKEGTAPDTDPPREAKADDGAQNDGDDDDDESDVQPTRRANRKAGNLPSRREGAVSPRTTRTGDNLTSPEAKRSGRGAQKRRQSSRAARGTSKKVGESDEDEYQEEEGEDSADDSMSNRSSPSKPPRSAQVEIEDEDDFSEPSSHGRKGKGNHPVTGGSQSTRKRRRASTEDLSQSENIHQELEDLLPSPKRLRQRAKRAAAIEGETAPERTLRRRTQAVDYRILRPENAILLEETEGSDGPQRRTAANAQRSWFDTTGPFGGTSGFSLFGRGRGAALQDDSDSSDDDRLPRPGMYSGVGPGGTIMTPSSAAAAGILPPVAQIHNSDPLGGAPGSLGKMSKGKNVNADVDPLGAADMDVDFSKVGGLDVLIQQLKEMVQLPLTYPELFLAKKITPPRGVLFHGPPGTGKTLMARALAASCSTETRKVTFYMRKGADCLSKWVGEAERQLRLLFEEAKNNQPSIIFFDEIDGLAPVRSSKQDQIHASIVSTMLALMDGMDGRGQVVVIGATNRPDAVDPALRRPGRFDREFYFPLPAMEARKSIIDIHTRGWVPPLSEKLKEGLAEQTKGFGGADLRSLCTEAALNAVQRTYPQIYMTTDKLALDPSTIHVTARDFMIARAKIIPSSERSSASAAAPLPSNVEPLLSDPLEQLKRCMEIILPERKRLTVLEEAMYEDDNDEDGGFAREDMMHDFEQARVFRPRMLIHGQTGMGQQYLGSAILHHFEKLHVQAFDLATLVGDPARSLEASIVQLFVEVKRHKPSVIYIQDIDTWHNSIGPQGLMTFKSLLRSIPANDPVLLLGVTSSEQEDLDPQLTHDLFGFSKRDKFQIPKPHKEARRKYFQKVILHIQKSPDEFPPDPATRRKRELPVLPVVPPPPPRALTKEERKARETKDKNTRNWLKMRLFNCVDTIRVKLRKFKKPVLEYDLIKHLFEEPDIVPDVTAPFPAAPSNYKLLPPKDVHSPPKILEVSSGKSYFNMDMDVIEERISSGYYCSPRHLLQDVERIRDDAIELGHKEYRMKAGEMATHLEMMMADLEALDPQMASQCDELWTRERKKIEGLAEKADRQKRAEEEARVEAEKVRDSVDRQTRAGSARPTTPPPPAAPAAPVSVGASANLSISAVISVPSTTSNGVKEANPNSSMEVQPSQTESSTNNTGPSSRQNSPPLAPQTPPHPSIQSQSTDPASAFQTAISSQPPTHSINLPQMTSQPGATIGVTPITGYSGILNYASTTTSGKRTSDGTGVNSQPFSNAYSNGTSTNTPRPMDPPAFHNFGGMSVGDSQLPDTQIVPSDSHPGPFFALPPIQTQKILDERSLVRLHERIVEETAGYTVEQLEQVFSAMMGRVWELRGRWDRNLVVSGVAEAFEEVDADVRLQGVDESFGSG